MNIETVKIVLKNTIYRILVECGIARHYKTFQEDNKYRLTGGAAVLKH